MTQTQGVNTRRSLSFALGLAFLLACEAPDASKGKEEGAVASSPSAEEQSPNARILPEPLESGAPTRAEAESPMTSALAEKLPKRREKPRPFPIADPLKTDTLKRGVGSGFEMQLQINWDGVRQSVKVEEQELATWPQVRVQLLREAPDRAARLRWILEGPAFPLPPGTELRAQADRVGHIVLWPNQRGYRVAPRGSLHSLFADRRVDRVPFVDAEISEPGAGSRLGKETIKRTLATPLGRVAMEFVDVKELPYASQLLCGTLLELVRVKAIPEICSLGALPVHFELTWNNEEKLTISVLSWGAVSQLDLDEFRMPPDLPIFKPGELPPFEDFFLDEKTRFELLPLTKKKGEPLPPPVSEPASEQPGKEPPSAPPPAPGPPRNQIYLKNELNRPLVLLMNKVPLVWLAPGDKLPLYLSSSEVRIAARDFLGETIFTERNLTAPAQLHFGGVAEKTAPEAESP